MGLKTPWRTFCCGADWGQVGKVHRFNIFAFTPGNYSIRRTGAAACHFDGEDGSAFFPRLSILEDCGLIDFIPHLCESASPESEIIHPCGIDWWPQGLTNRENEVGWAANEAGKAMADFPKYVVAGLNGATLAIPVAKHYPHTQVVGVARMRYRPRTRRTLTWLEECEAKLATHIERYKQLRREAEQRRTRVAAGG